MILSPASIKVALNLYTLFFHFITKIFTSLFKNFIILKHNGQKFVFYFIICICILFLVIEVTVGLLQYI